MIINFICSIAVNRLIRHRSLTYRFRLVQEIFCFCRGGEMMG